MPKYFFSQNQPLLFRILEFVYFFLYNNWMNFVLFEENTAVTIMVMNKTRVWHTFHFSLKNKFLKL